MDLTIYFDAALLATYPKQPIVRASRFVAPAYTRLLERKRKETETKRREFCRKYGLRYNEVVAGDFHPWRWKDESAVWLLAKGLRRARGRGLHGEALHRVVYGLDK
jgi:hypothetical protein